MLVLCEEELLLHSFKTFTILDMRKIEKDLSGNILYRSITH